MPKDTEPGRNVPPRAAATAQLLWRVSQRASRAYRGELGRPFPSGPGPTALPVLSISLPLRGLLAAADASRRLPGRGGQGPPRESRRPFDLRAGDLSPVGRRLTSAIQNGHSVCGTGNPASAPVTISATAGMIH
jgi:hypothetical protein